MKDIKIIATIGPSSNSLDILQKMKDRGVSFFRINLSHTNEEDIEKRILDIKDVGVPMILDTEGLQVRSGNLEEIDFSEGKMIKLYGAKVSCDENNLCLNPPEIIKYLDEGDLISIDFNSLLLKVFDISSYREKNFIECKVVIPGKIGGKKAVCIDSLSLHLPAFSKKDKRAIEIAKKHKIKHFTLSFMESKKDVEEFKSYYSDAIVYSKIESKRGLDNFIEIAEASDGLLIDRGDLSSQVPLERIPFIQKFIIKKCLEMNKAIFVATNTLEQMSFSLKPNRAEVNDIVTLLLDGATGIALTKETAVGKYPIETINMLTAIIKQIAHLKPNDETDIVRQIEKTNYLFSSQIPEFLIKPHGGRLINRIISQDFIHVPTKRILIDEETLMDIEQIAVGSFSPLEGFLCKNDFESVVSKMKLCNGIVWPLPITFSVVEEVRKNLLEGDEIALVYKEDQEVYAILKLQEIYKIDKEIYAEKIYGTTRLDHPGVKKFIGSGEYFLGGKITLIKRRNSQYKFHELTPLQTRKLFVEKGWTKIVGFHTRNAIHKAHEFIQMEALKLSLADGLFLHPVIGKKKSGDFKADIILRTYEEMINSFYPKNKVVLSTWASYSRYCGPREALFTAIVRKNFGCSHFIVGRDHTGVGNFYQPQASNEIFNRFKPGEIGIIPLNFDKVFYSTIKGEYVLEKDMPNHPEDKKLHLSGTQMRNLLKSGKLLPEWFMRKEISDIILEKIKKGEKVFVD